MARRVQTTDDFGLSDWWSSIPRVTRVLGSLWLGTAVAATFGILPLHYLYLDFKSIFRKGQVTEFTDSVDVSEHHDDRFGDW